MSQQEARAVIEPDRFPVYEKVNLNVRIKPGKKLEAGAVVECQLPNSFSNDKISPSFVKPWQTASPHGDHFASVAVAGESAAEFTLEIKPREFVGGYESETRHGRCFVVTINQERSMLTRRSSTRSKTRRHHGWPISAPVKPTTRVPSS